MYSHKLNRFHRHHLTMSIPLRITTEILDNAIVICVISAIVAMSVDNSRPFVHFHHALENIDVTIKLGNEVTTAIIRLRIFVAVRIRKVIVDSHFGFDDEDYYWTENYYFLIIFCSYKTNSLYRLFKGSVH